MYYFDFHCHLDLAKHFEAEVAQAEADKLYSLMVTTTPRAWSHNNELTVGLKYVRAALGIHPQLVNQPNKELLLLHKYLWEAKYVGEIGLDFRKEYSDYNNYQIDVFRNILVGCNNLGNKILSVHSLRAEKTVLDMIEKYVTNKSCKIILHWFVGGTNLAKRAAKMGCYFSINIRMINTVKGGDLVNVIPQDKILTESDYPFVKVGTRLGQIQNTVKLLSEYLSISEIAMRQLIYENASKLLIY